MATTQFRNKPLAERKADADRIASQFPGRIGVIVEKSRRARSDLPPLDRSKFLVPNELPVGSLMQVLRKRMDLQPDQAIFLFAQSKNGKAVTPPVGTTMLELWNAYREDDGFVYLSYSAEATFG